MTEGQANQMLSRCRGAMLALFSAMGPLLIPGTIVADDTALPPDHGFMLIRLQLSANERVDMLQMSNRDTNQVVSIRGKSFQAAGVHAWLALAAVPRGRYFISEYVPKLGVAASERQLLGTRFRWNAPDSDRETFEIAPGVVNYVGDWTMRINASRRTPLNPVIQFDKSTLELYIAQYPERANNFEVYLSAIGKKAISLSELAQN